MLSSWKVDTGLRPCSRSWIRSRRYEGVEVLRILNVSTATLYSIICWTGSQCNVLSNGLAWDRLGASRNVSAVTPSMSSLPWGHSGDTSWSLVPAACLPCLAPTPRGCRTSTWTSPPDDPDVPAYTVGRHVSNYTRSATQQLHQIIRDFFYFKQRQCDINGILSTNFCNLHWTN